MRLLLQLLLLLSSFQLHAQLGFKIGITSSNLISRETYYPQDGYELSEKPYFNAKIKPQVGFLMNLKAGDVLSIRPEVLLSMRGSVISGQISQTFGKQVRYTSYENDVDLGYLEVPVNLVVHFRLKKHEIQLYAGPYFAIGIFGKGTMKKLDQRYSNNTWHTYSYTDFEYEPFHNGRKTDMGLNAGMSFFLSKKFLFSIQYSKSALQPQVHSIPYELETDGGRVVFEGFTFNAAVFFKSSK